MHDPLDQRCRRARRQLLELAISDSPDPAVPDSTATHLRDCAACSGYAQALRSAPVLFSGPQGFGPALRQRTIAAATDAREAARYRRLVWLAAPAALLVLFLSFAIPAWLLSIPLSTVIESDALALGLGLLIVHLAGLLPAGLCAALGLRHRSRPKPLEEVSS